MAVISFEYPSWKDLETIDYRGSFWNDSDIANLNATLVQTALKLKQVNKLLNEWDRKRTEADLNYKRLFRSTLLSAQGKTEGQKRLIAEVQCEELETQVAYADEMLRELNRISMSLRLDLETLKTIGFNLRQEMRI